MFEMRSLLIVASVAASLVAIPGHGVLAMRSETSDEIVARIDGYVRAEMTRQRIPGLSLAVAHEGRLVVARGYGFANLEHQVPATDRTIYQSGSVGKQFTAAAVMLLVEDGRLSLDDRLSTFFENSPESWKAITVRHLLTHTSGIANYTAGTIDYRRDYAYPELVELAARLPQDFAPGESWSYSNTGYLLLGLVIEKASGQFYGDLLRDRVFRPLGMDTARVISEAELVTNRAAGYEMVKGEWRNQAWVSPSLNTTADGALYLTVRDLASWDAALTARRLLEPSSYEAMWTPVRLNNGRTEPYGFGWRLGSVNGHDTVSHSGAWQGFLARIARYERDRLSVMILVNTSLANLERIEQGVASLFVPDLAPRDIKPIADADPAVTARLRALLDRIVSGHVPPDECAPELRSEMTPEEVASLRGQLEEPGRWRDLALIGATTGENGARRFEYRLDYGGPTLLIDFGLSSSGQVTTIAATYD